MCPRPLPENRPNSARKAAGKRPAPSSLLPMQPAADAVAVVLKRLILLRSDVGRLQAAIATNARLRDLMGRELEGCRILLDSSIADAAEDLGGRGHE